MSKRAASNILVARACVDSESGIGEIPPENILNYDETNFRNDSGKTWVIVRRGRRRVEKVSDDMWCGSAAGHMLPPMVVYASENVYETYWNLGFFHFLRLVQF